MKELKQFNLQAEAQAIARVMPTVPPQPMETACMYAQVRCWQVRAAGERLAAVLPYVTSGLPQAVFIEALRLVADLRENLVAELEEAALQTALEDAESLTTIGRSVLPQFEASAREVTA